jgi:hypothetical protein
LKESHDQKPGKMIVAVGAAITAAFAAVGLGFALKRPVFIFGGTASIVLGYLVLYIARRHPALLTSIALTGWCLGLSIWACLVIAPPTATGFTWHETAAAIASIFCAFSGACLWWPFDTRGPKTKEKDVGSES